MTDHLNGWRLLAVPIRSSGFDRHNSEHLRLKYESLLLGNAERQGPITRAPRSAAIAAKDDVVVDNVSAAFITK